MSMLTTDQIDQLHTEGYLLVKGVLDPELDIEPVQREFEAILDRVAHDLQRDGKITDTHDGLPFEERFIAVATDSPDPIIYHFEIALPNGGFTEATPINCGQNTLNFLRSPRIMDLIEPLVGPEIYCNPVQHTRIKLPASVPARAGNLTDATQWHQDQGVVLPEADRTHTITVWAAMTDASVENGCLKYEQRSHRTGLAFHCPVESSRKKYAGAIPDEWIDDDQAVPVPAERGDILLHLPLTKHGSLPNRSDRIRWSFDLRYHPTGEPTGRPMFPGFVARSRSDPASELTSASEWKALWEDARNKILGKPMPKLYRWNTDAEFCA